MLFKPLEVLKEFLNILYSKEHSKYIFIVILFLGVSVILEIHKGNIYLLVIIHLGSTN